MKKKSLTSNILWSIAILIFIAVMFSFIFENTGTSETLSLDQLATKINAGEVQSISVNGSILTIQLKDGKTATSKKEAEAGITETLHNYGVDTVAFQKVNLSVEEESGFRFWAGILIPTLLPLLIIGGIFWFMFRQARGGMNQAFTFGKANVKMFASFKDRVLFKDVAGLKEAKNELEEVVDFLKNPKKFLEIGAKIPRGALLMGAPGTGKTLLARAVAGEANVPFFHMSASEFVEMFVGVGASRVRDLFDVAKRSAPAIIFIDEIDAVGRERGAGLGGGHDEREQTLNQILVEMDGFERDTRVIVMAATNRPDILDSALLRPGRFDRRVFLDLPDINDREAILRIHSQGKLLGKDADLRRVAVRTPGFSGADLANLMNEAAISAARKNQKIINQLDVLESIEKVMLGPERKGRVISDKEKEITAYHEAGHALMAASLKDADPVQKVSIISRGRAGGYTLKLPLEEQHLKTKRQFLADLSVALGGYVSEETTFGDVSTGSSNDLKEASEMARRLVTQYGMSKKLGPITFGKSDDMIFLGHEITTQKNYSEAIASQIDEEVSSFMKFAQDTAKKIIVSRKKVLQALAMELIKKETIEHEDFYNLLKPFNLKPVTIAV
ncbi:MAG TPA: ATP-dependent zinc metalloprotease FtsH [Candidatus Paceibacterota bacterium]